FFFFFFSSRRRHTRFDCDWSSDVCSSDLLLLPAFIVSVSFMFISFAKANNSATKMNVSKTNSTDSALVVNEVSQGERLFNNLHRSEERRVGKEYRSLFWSAD